MSTEALAQALEQQAQACDAFGSHFTAELARQVRADVLAGGPALALFAPWAEASLREVVAAAAALRLFGALHDLVLSGEAPALAACYPDDARPGDAAAAWRAAAGLPPQHRQALAAFMTHEPQTNEVRRSAALLGGFHHAARRAGLPLRVFELGASAGLNQLWDRFRYDLGEGGAWGAPDSPVRLTSGWSGAAPVLAPGIEIIERAACDRRPVDLRDPAERRRLQAYVWPDQRERLANLRAAIDLALAAGVSPEPADAAEWAAARAAPKTGALTVLFHSVFWQYMPAQSQAATQRAIEAHGRSASAQAPFASLRLEPSPQDLKTFEVRVTCWPGGEDALLAHSHPHGAWVEWLEARR